MTAAADPGVFRAKAQARWQPDCPDWVVVLAEEVDRASQTVVARKMGVSNGLVSAVLSNTYKGDMKAAEGRVRGAFLGETVDCPVMGDVARQICLAEQAKNFTGTSAQRTRQYHACRSGCPHSRFKGDQS